MDNYNVLSDNIKKKEDDIIDNIVKRISNDAAESIICEIDGKISTLSSRVDSNIDIQNSIKEKITEVSNEFDNIISKKYIDKIEIIKNEQEDISRILNQDKNQLEDFLILQQSLNSQLKSNITQVDTAKTQIDDLMDEINEREREIDKSLKNLNETYNNTKILCDKFQIHIESLKGFFNDETFTRLSLEVATIKERTEDFYNKVDSIEQHIEDSLKQTDTLVIEVNDSIKILERDNNNIINTIYKLGTIVIGIIIIMLQFFILFK